MVEEPGLGEVARRLDDVFKRFESLANDLPRTFVSKDLFDAYRQVEQAHQDQLKTIVDAQEKRIGELEDDKKWLWRLVVGAIILALLGLLFTTSKSLNGGSSNSTGTKTKAVAVTMAVTE